MQSHSQKKLTNYCEENNFVIPKNCNLDVEKIKELIDRPQFFINWSSFSALNDSGELGKQILESLYALSKKKDSPESIAGYYS